MLLLQILLGFVRALGKPMAKRNLHYRELIERMRKNEIILIDVRERSEISQDGAIPGSKNIPQQELKAALVEISKDEFQKRYGFPLPNKQTVLVFSCRSGNRSKKAMDLALSLGYVKLRGLEEEQWLRMTKATVPIQK